MSSLSSIENTFFTSNAIHSRESPPASTPGYVAFSKQLYFSVELKSDLLRHVFVCQRRESEECVMKNRSSVQNDTNPLVCRQLRQLGIEPSQLRIQTLGIQSIHIQPCRRHARVTSGGEPEELVGRVGIVDDEGGGNRDAGVIHSPPHAHFPSIQLPITLPISVTSEGLNPGR